MVDNAQGDGSDRATCVWNWVHYDNNDSDNITDDIDEYTQSSNGSGGGGGIRDKE